jgi:glycosyltransferase involved in cell wall biosynthesis
LNQQLFSLAAQLRGWEVTLVLPRAWRDEYGNVLSGQLLKGFPAELVTIPVVGSGSVPLHVYRGDLGAVLRRAAPDFVYSHNEAYALSTMQWCRANARVLKRPFGFFSCQNIEKRYPLPFRIGESWVYRNSAMFFPITDAVEKVHRQKGYGGPALVVPLGYDPDVYSPRVRSCDKSPFGAVTIGYIGRFVEQKGLLTLFRALTRLRSVSWRLLMVGDGPQRAELVACAELGGFADRIEWRGYVPHAAIPDVFSEMDCLVLPSETRGNWKEQFGRVLVESMACEVPVVGSDSGEIPSIIRSTGGGLVFHEGDDESCATALASVLSDRDGRLRMARRGCDAVAKAYALPALAGRFADAVESCVRG